MNENEGGRKVEVLISNLLAERRMSLRGLTRLSGIEPSNLNNLTNGKRQKIYLGHIERIADASEIDDISRMLKLNRKQYWGYKE